MMVSRKKSAFNSISRAKRVSIWLIIISGYCFLSLPVQAQTNAGILLSISKTEINTTNQELVNVTLKVTNTTNVAVDIALKIALETSMQLVSKDHILFTCLPGDSLFIPVKIFINNSAEAGIDHLVNFSLHDVQGRLLNQKSLKVTVALKRNVVLLSLISSLLLSNETDSVIIPIQVSNTGNTAQKIQIVGQFPTIFQNETFPATKQFIIKPSTDTLIYFKKAVNREMFNSEGFNVNITGLYADNDIFGMGYIRVQSARSNRRYPIQLFNEKLGENYIRVSSQSMFLPYQSYLFNGNGNLPLLNGFVNYNYDITTWKNNYSPASIRNTYINYIADNKGFTIGTINRNLEIFLSGRGLTAFIADTASHNRYEAGYINENTDILNNSFFNPVSGQAAWGTMSHTGKKWGLKNFAIFQTSPLLNARNMLVGSAVSLSGLHFRFSGNLGAGYTSEFKDIHSNKFGIAGGADLSGTIKKISFSSSNFVSSGYYPGTRKGAMTFLHRITWLKDRFSLWANMDYYKYNPKSLGDVTFALPVFSNFHTELGVSVMLTDRLQTSFLTGYSIERNDAYQFIGEPRRMQSMHAVKGTATLNYFIGSNHYLTFTSENGLYNTSFDPIRHFRLRSTVNYHFGLLSLHSTYQRGFFFLGEAANQFRKNAVLFRSVNASATVHKNYFRDRLITEAGIAFQYNTYTSKNWYVTGRLEYVFLKGTSFYAAINHTEFGQQRLNIVETGFIHKLRLIPRIGIKTRTIDLLVYKDVNKNDRYDSADSLAIGYLILINDNIFVTSSKGTIRYKNLPAGDYLLATISSNGWYAPAKQLNPDSKNRIEIALKQTGTIKGAVVFKSSEFSYEVTRSLSGIAINAIDEQGKIFTIRTNSDGNYTMFVPIGKYSVALNTKDFPVEIEVTGLARQIEVSAGSTIVNNYALKVKSKQVESKKFVSPNQP